ncbi:aldehyde dehydrogenase family protein [Deinococcus sp.]|uniref:aldehyde dehydrogenase family protein n=1 Tax=Deinococcus sp. TaxID=47478 RepID=UPI0025C1FBFD|nr:aldehyde dehydrogenase family protein [Deinococcus sp.]
MTAPQELSALATQYTQLYINGEFQSAQNGATFQTFNPATGEVLATISAAGAADIDRAVHAAHAQFAGGEWSKMDGTQRGRLLYKLADLLERDHEKLARLESLDSGKPYGMAFYADLPNLMATYRYYAGLADKLEGRSIPVPDMQGRPVLAYTVREPLGVIASIGAYNFSTMYLGWKAAPALAAGNTVVFKPAEDATLTSLHVAALFSEAGFPPGAFNMVPGLGPVTGDALVRHPLVAKLSYTGGGAVGRVLARSAAENLKPLTLELGGKAPQIVLEDADLSSVIPTLAMGLFANQGQICAAGTRIVVHRSLYDAVCEGLSSAAKAQVLGDPLDMSSTMGPLTNQRSVERVMNFIDQGKAEGAKLLAGGEQLAQPGYFVQPTIFAGDNTMTVAQEEIFGPVGIVIPFDSDDEAVQIANDTKYGLNAGIFTRDISRANLLARRIQTGAVWINGFALIDPRLPWGGVKESGYGRENGGWSGIEDVTHEKVITALL